MISAHLHPQLDAYLALRDKHILTKMYSTATTLYQESQHKTSTFKFCQQTYTITLLCGKLKSNF